MTYGKKAGIFLMLLAVLVCLAGFGLADVRVDEAHFPDACFREYVSGMYWDADHDGTLSDTELAKVTVISCRNKQIGSLQGIEYFTALETLDCYGNQLTSLDVSKNTRLTSLCCSHNELTVLDVSKNILLTRLECSFNDFKVLDVSKNAQLTSLMCDNNHLTALDVSGNGALKSLSCGSNLLTALNVSGSLELTSLLCNYNLLTDLDLTKHTKLEVLYCNDNKLTELNLASESPVYKLPSLVEAEDRGTCWVYYLRDEDGRILQGLTFDKSVSNPFIVEVNPGVALDEAHFPDDVFRAYIVDKGFDQNGDGFLSAKELAAVDEIVVQDMNIESLKGLEYFTEITGLWCAYNRLTELDVSKNTKLTYIDCYVNQIESLSVTKLTELTDLECSHNQLSVLDLSRNPKLMHLYCDDNYITDLDVSACSCLTELLETETPDDHETYWQFSKHLDEYEHYTLAYDKYVRIKPALRVDSVSLNKTKATLKITLKKKNPALQLKAAVLPEYASNQELTWKSSNPKVATVSASGKVTAREPGTCKITAAAKDGGGQKAVCVITVRADEIQSKDLYYSLNHTDKTAAVTGAAKTGIKQIKIPATVSANGRTYKVTSVAAGAFKGLKSLAAFSTGRNLTTIGKSAFEGCTKLKKITVESKKITKIGKRAFKSIHKKPSLVISFKPSASYLSKLVKLLTAGGMPKVTPQVP